MPAAPTSVASAGSVLTDGTGVSQITVQKFIKDFVADFLISAAAALAAANVVGLGDVVNAPNVAVFAVAGALLRSGYRAALKWATT